MKSKQDWLEHFLLMCEDYKQHGECAFVSASTSRLAYGKAEVAASDFALDEMMKIGFTVNLKIVGSTAMYYFTWTEHKRGPRCPK